MILSRSRVNPVHQPTRSCLNYLGFPLGISGQMLAARAFAQAEKFGTDIAIARTASRVVCDRRPYRVEFNGQSVVTRTIVIATGARYHKPALAQLERFEGVGIYYCATALEARLCRGDDVIVVGGANSAGQAAVFLARTARKVHLLVRATGLSSTMSRYLIRRIAETPNIELRVRDRRARRRRGARAHHLARRVARTLTRVCKNCL